MNGVGGGGGGGVGEETEKVVLMWGYLPGVSPQRSQVLSPTAVPMPESYDEDWWSDVCGSGRGFAMAVSESGKLFTWGSTDDMGQSYVASGKHEETPESFPLPEEVKIVSAAAGLAHCVAVTGSEYLLKEAKIRWFRPSEIYQILHTYHRYNLSQDPPNKPPSGSLFLFDRKVQKNFRKDGHSWKKNKSGKNVQEAHEKLKCDNVAALHCYYSHGEENKNFHRRTYWLLDKQMENIVLVHYRDLHEGRRILMEEDPTTQLNSTS